MLFNVAQLLKAPVGETREFALGLEPPVHAGRVEIMRTPRGALVRVQADVLIEASCSRCLIPFCYPAHIEFEEIYRQQVDVVTGVRLAGVEGEDEDEFLIGTDHSIDISEAVRQYTEMAADLQPLCRPDCPGLCPQCGQDLAMGRCDCQPGQADPRWAALSALTRESNG